MAPDKGLQRNISLIYVIGSLMWGRFFIPVIALFYVASQVSLGQFSIIMAVFSLSTLVFEIPTGVLSDLLGRKNTLLFARFFYLIEVALLAFANGFWLLLLAKFISGIGVSLSSGTDQSLLYDTLKGLKREKEHKRIAGNKHTITYISMAIVFIIGAYLFSLGDKVPALASLPLIFAGFILTFFIKEPPKETQRRLNLKNYFAQLKEGLTLFYKDDTVKYLTLFSFPIAAATSIILTLSSAYLEAILIPVSLIGVVSFVGAMASAFASKSADKWESKLGQKKFIFIVQILTFAAVFLMSFMFSYLGTIFYLIIPLVSGFFVVVTNHYLNIRIPSSHRASILSIRSMFDNLAITIFFPVIGYMTGLWSMGTSLLIFSIFLFVYFILLFIYRNFSLRVRGSKAK